MEIPKIHEGEYRFCLIMWEHEPIAAAQLVKLCQEQLGWKRTTTYRLLLPWRFSAVSARPGQGGSWNRQAPAVAAPFSRSVSFPPASAL